MQIYDEQYKIELSKGYEFSPHKSLIELLRLFESLFSLDFIEPTSLELGCGLGLHTEALGPVWNIEGLEISPVAAQVLSSQSKAHIYQEDFLEFDNIKYWNLVFDSHLLHCLIGVKAYKRYFEKVNSCLSSGGYLVLEVMCQSKAMCFDNNQKYDENTNILYESELPVRTILNSRDIEQLIVESGLKVVYLRVDEIIKFIPNSQRSESRPTDPDRMRIICLKE